jgi:excisionase family DNA binding protein
VTDLLTLAEAADRLRLSLNTVYKLCRNREIPATKLGRQWRIRAADLDRHLGPQRSALRARPGAGDDPLRA